MSLATKRMLASYRMTLAACAVIGILAGFGVVSGSSQPPAQLEIKTLSSRPDLVSGGDALIEIKAPAGTQLSQLALTPQRQRCHESTQA